MINLSELTKTYQMGKTELDALQGIDFSMARGEFVSVMGPSGSGKSTLMNIIGCLDRATSGSYHFEGVEINKLGNQQLARIRREKIGFVFQGFNLLPRYTALANVELPMIYRGLPSSQRKEEALEALEMVGLADRAEHRPNELSGGQAQRVAIARALVNKPSLILADEPTGSLDSETGQDIMELFSRLNDEGIGILLVTHEAQTASYAKRTVFFKDGNIVTKEEALPGLEFLDGLRSEVNSN